jgi:hypothetical protein
MNTPRSKLIVVAIVAVVMLLGLGLYANRKHSPSSTSQSGQSGSASSGSGSSSSSTSSNNTNKPTAAAVAVVRKYIQAQQDSVGADQTSPTSWLASVQAITTPSWFASLQPQTSSTGNVPADYNTAHDNNYIVTAAMTSCIWNLQYPPPTATSGTIYCQFSDTTLNKADNTPVTGSSLPFGWTETGPQSPVSVQIVNQGGSWLVTNVPTSR